MLAQSFLHEFAIQAGDIPSSNDHVAAAVKESTAAGKLNVGPIGVSPHDMVFSWSLQWNHFRSDTMQVNRVAVLHLGCGYSMFARHQHGGTHK